MTKQLREPTLDPLTHITKREVALLCGVNPWTIDRWRKHPSNNFPQPVWLSDVTPRWSRDAIAAWLQSRPSGGLSPNNPGLRRGATRVRLGKKRVA
jgi:predicted DNA-binding transcriptional regulator AlpA